MKDRGTPEILLVSSRQATSYLIKDRFVKMGFKLIQTSGLQEFLNQDNNIKPSIIILDHKSNSDSNLILEMAILAKETFKEAFLFAIYDTDSSLDAAELFRVGLSGIFLYPYEEELLVNSVLEFCPIELDSKALNSSCMNEVHILELTQGKPVPFDVYIFMPKNQKFLLYKMRNSIFEEELASRFKEKGSQLFYIKKTDLPAYYRYTSEVLSEIKNNKELNLIERRRELKTQVQNLMCDFFAKSNLSDAEASQFTHSVKRIVCDFLDIESDTSLFDKVAKLASKTFSNYTHSINTAAYCVMFGILAEFDDVENLSLGGILHDIGLSRLESDTNLQCQISIETFDNYREHPKVAVELIESKKIPLPEIVKDMILQHHENPDGSGFPYGLKKEDISPFAKILSFADYFDELTSKKEGTSNLSPREALIKLSDSNDSLFAPFFDPEFHDPLIKSLLENKKVDFSKLQTDSSEDPAAIDPV